MYCVIFVRGDSGTLHVAMATLMLPTGIFFYIQVMYIWNLFTRTPHNREDSLWLVLSTN
jgi:hypothetical protein